MKLSPENLYHANELNQLQDQYQVNTAPSSYNTQGKDFRTEAIKAIRFIKHSIGHQKPKTEINLNLLQRKLPPGNLITLGLV